MIHLHGVQTDQGYWLDVAVSAGHKTSCFRDEVEACFDRALSERPNWTGNDYLDALYDQLDGMAERWDNFILYNRDLTAAELIETGFYEVRAATSRHRPGSSCT